MATLDINGQHVTVDDSFLKLSPDEQQATVDHIASNIQPAPDKYQQAATEEIQHLKDIGAPLEVGYTRRSAHGATFYADNTILAAAAAPLEMIKHRTWSSSEGYNYAKAREDQLLEEARKNTGILGSAVEMLGGAGAASALAKAGVTTMRMLAPEAGVISRSLASAADAGGIGAVSGFNEGNGLSDRLDKAAKGALYGGLTGVALPVAGSLMHSAASPFISNIMARANPEGYAARQVARGIVESGRSTGDIADAVVNATNEGQGVFNVADAMGNSGQRLLSTVARAPGAGRTAVVDASGRSTGNSGAAHQ